MIYDYTASPASQLPSMTHEGVSRGDIIQLLEGYFHEGGKQRWAGLPNHTVVVTQNRGRGIIEVVEQNGAEGKLVGRGTYNFKAMEKGNVKIYRVVGVGGGQDKLDVKW